jgi:outer membrane receptor protein involved in Fe transport
VAGLRADRYRFDVSSDAREASLLSPKLSAIFGPFGNTELYANAGWGFHSNDGRAAVTSAVSPLARTKAAEVGLRSTSIPRLHLTAALWSVDIASELLFVGDAGSTEAGEASRRRGVEVASLLDLRRGLVVDASYAWSRARFRDGDRIPGAVEGVASVGMSVIDGKRFSGEVRWRWFGPRPLVEDDSVRSSASSLVSARVGYGVTPHVRVDVDALNLLDAKASDVDYFYASRLRGEASAVEDVHFHPVEKRSFRIGIVTSF